MYKELKFVQGAVARKDFVPELTHFQIRNGFVRGYNGTIALCAPIQLDFDCLPKAEPLIKAIQNCQDTIQLSMTSAGRLSIRSGTFKAFIECFDSHETPDIAPEGDHIEVDGAAFLHGLRTVAPFVSDDASRPWSNGALFRGQSVFATNNVVLVECWLGVNFPREVNVPRQAIKELLRINEPPVRVQCTDTSMTFHYAEGRWIRTQLLELAWPDVGKVLNKECQPVPFPEQFFEGLKTLKPFVDSMGRVLFSLDGLHTHADDEEGASFDIQNFGCQGVYRIENLLLLDGVAKTIDFSKYPEPALFFGGNVRGAIIGMLP